MKRNTVLVVVVAVVLAGSGFAVAQSSFFGTSSGLIEHQAPNGPSILTEDVDYEDPVPIRNKSIDFGHTNFTGEGYAEASNFGGDLQLQNISTQGTLFTERAGMYRVGVDSNISALTISSTNLNSTQTDLSVTGTDTVTVTGFDASQVVRVERSQSGDTFEIADANGTITFTAADEDVSLVEGDAPTMTNPQPVDTIIDSSTVTLSADVDHDDFDTGISVDLDWQVNGTTINTTTVTSPGTYSITTDEFGRGQNNWTVTATDPAGQTDSVSGSFGTPTVLEIRDENTGELVTTTTDIEVTFFGEDETVITRTTQNGTIDMSGLPLDQGYTIQANATDYFERQTFAPSVADQHVHYLLNKSATAVETEFTLTDPTGEFSPENSRVYIKKAVTINGTTEYRTIIGDRIGTGSFSTLLEQDERYLIEVENIETGERRELGPYVSTSSGVIELELDEIDFGFSGEVADTGYEWNAEYINETAPAIDFAFDYDGRLERLDVVIRQRGGNETEIFNETYLNLEGTVQERILLPENIENPDQTTWVVEWNATNSPSLKGSTIVGKAQMPLGLGGVDETILSFAGVFIILLVAGLFSAANISVGAIATSLVAAGLWFIGVLPDAVSGLAIAVALLVGVLYHARRGPAAQGGTRT